MAVFEDRYKPDMEVKSVSEITVAFNSIFVIIILILIIKMNSIKKKNETKVKK